MYEPASGDEKAVMLACKALSSFDAATVMRKTALRQRCDFRMNVRACGRAQLEARPEAHTHYFRKWRN